MACAITLAADNESQAPILELWNQVAAFEAVPSMPTQNYPPHITLALLPEMAASDVWRRVRHVAAGARPLGLCFNAIRTFDAPPLVLWASPVPTGALSDWHAKIHRHLDLSACHEHHRPENWVPHCTLGTGTLARHKQRALDLTARQFKPFKVVFDRFDCVTFPPVQVSASVRL